MNDEPRDDEGVTLSEWAEGARNLLTNVASSVGLPDPAATPEQPQVLVPYLDGLLASVSIDAMSEDQFWNLNAQLIAVSAQILVVTKGAHWVLDEDSGSPFHGKFVLSMPDEIKTARYFDPAAGVHEVLMQTNPTVEKIVAIGMTALCLD
ncbi:hypothetical protein [Amycolatopsis sp. MEPSY49]|uniref:hypothetical protein n=1 Tax=Amycolatopsis sp. MEPSY49 TaxID=3151600 RepID=UPI003EF08CB0